MNLSHSVSYPGVNVWIGGGCYIWSRMLRTVYYICHICRGSISGYGVSLFYLIPLVIVLNQTARKCFHQMWIQQFIIIIICYWFVRHVSSVQLLRERFHTLISVFICPRPLTNTLAMQRSWLFLYINLRTRLGCRYSADDVGMMVGEGGGGGQGRRCCCFAAVILISRLSILFLLL